MEMERRTILKLVAAGVLPGSGGLVQLASGQDNYTPEFFSNSQLQLLDALTEVILPADDHSPGAKVAKVARYIDVMVADGTRQAQRDWRSGLKAVTKLTKKRFKNDFADCDAGQQDTIVAEMSRNEDNPTNGLERFFATVKKATVDGYYTSKTGIHEDFGYKGNTAVDEFGGCDHQEHT